MKYIKAEWTGSYPCLCCGEWKLEIDGTQVPMPEGAPKGEMGTYGIYQSWHFEDGWEEVWVSYEDGLPCDEWLEANANWISQLGLTPAEQVRLFDAIRREDWRHNSCGGCI